MNRESYMSPGFQTEVQRQLRKPGDYSRVAKILAAMNIPFEDAYQLIFMRPPRALKSDNLDFTCSHAFANGGKEGSTRSIFLIQFTAQHRLNKFSASTIACVICGQVEMGNIAASDQSFIVRYVTLQ